MKFFHLALAVFCLSAVVACSKSSLSTGSPGKPPGEQARIGHPVPEGDDSTSPSPSSVPLVAPLERSALKVCANDLLKEYKDVQDKCKGVDDPFTHSDCFYAKDDFDKKNPNTACKAPDNSFVICNRTDGSCSGLANDLTNTSDAQ